MYVYVGYLCFVIFFILLFLASQCLVLRASSELPSRWLQKKYSSTLTLYPFYYTRIPELRSLERH
jgi:hypothetical protein